MRVSFGELRIGDVARRYLQSAVEKNWASQGENVAEFERRFAERFGYAEAVACSSGTDAVIISVAALHDFGAERGDEVITPACSFVATANAILAAGFTPKFVDVDRSTLNIDPAQIEAAITPRTRAIVAVHTMGKPCDMDAITDIAQRRGLRVIEDACEAHGAKHRNRYVGGIGDAGQFSFYAAHLICSGEGGMAVTNDPEWAAILRSVRSHGRPTGSDFFEFQRFGTNSKMNDLEAALGIEGIDQFDATFDQRKIHMNRLLELTDDLEEFVERSRQAPHELISPHAFHLVLRNPDHDMKKLYAFLEDSSIQCKTLFGSLPTQHRAFGFLGHQLGEFPNSEYIGDNGLHFGVHQHLQDDDLEFVSERLHSYFKAL